MSSDITTEVEENQIADNPTDILPKLPTEPQSEPTTNSNNDELPNRSKVTSVQAIGKNLLQQRKTSKDSDDDEIVLIRSNPETKIRQINKSAYAKLQRSLAENRSVKLIDDLKGVYENKSSTDDSQVEKPDVVQVRIKRSSTIKADGEAAQSIKSRYTPSSFGYTSQTSHSKLPVPRPRSLQTQSKPDVPFKTISHFSLPPTQKKDENSNLISNKSIAESSEFISVVTRSESEHSIDKINAELNQFTMERKPREKKRSGSFRKIFNGSLFGRDKKKKEEEKNKYQNVVNMYSDNVQNDGNTFNRQSPFRHTVDGGVKTNNEVKVTRSVTTSNCKASDLEKKYADLHINNFNHARKNFEIPTEDYVDMSNNSNQTSKGRIYLNAPSISKYIDTSSSASTAGSEKLNTYDKTNNGGVHELARYSNIPLPTRNTPPRAQETRQDVKLVNPKALIPINSERPLPNPYQNEGDSKNMESKGGEESTNNVHLDETYGTVADSVEYRRRPHSNKEEDKAPSRSPSFESTKLKLPPNRDIYRLEPRVKSPIPQANVSAEKIIATELLKSSRSPTPPRRNIKQTQQRDHVDYPRETQNRNYENYNTITEPVVSSKPPRGNSVQRTNEPIYSSEKFTTSAMVHSPTLKSPTPTNVLNRSLSPVTIRSTTPNDLRSSSSLKLSPQKEDIRRNVEAYYWNEIKKLQEQEYADYYYHMQYSRDPVQIRKSRSSSPHVNRSRRALSLPRDVRPENYQLVQGASGNSYIIQPNAIPEGRAVINQVNSRNSFSVPGNYQQAFIRNTLERSTIEGSPRRMVDNGSLSRPIFKRGSLTKQAAEEEEQQINKKVSFSNLNRAENQQWPTRNGYTQSPPQRRIDKVESPLEDDVFIQQGPVYDYAVRRQNAPRQVPAHYYSDSEEIYFKMPPRNNPQNVANNQMARFLQAKRQQQEQDLYCQPRDFIPNPVYGLTRHGSISSQEGFYGHRVPPGIRRRPSYDSGSFSRQNFQEPHYANRPLVPPPIEPPRRRELILAGDESFSQPLNQTVPIAAANQRNSQYSSRQALAEAIYSRTGPRQISIRNKVCDIYGQIHEGESPYGQVQRSGVIMGQLQQTPSGVIVRQPVNGQFVRGTRLTASANDMYRNYQNVEARYRSGPVYVQNDAPSKPLPPLPNKSKKIFRHVSDTDSVSDASEIQRITNSSAKTKKRSFFEEEWNADGKSGRGISGNDSGRSDNEGEVRGRSRNTRRDDPRRHTLGGDQQYLAMAGQGGPLSRTMDLEGQPRGYPPPSNAMLFDDDPGIMSEVETSSTGFRRGGKQRSSLPVVRTPSKTLERPLGLVFLQYRNETKRALLPNEITSIDTVKALFVRSFSKQLSMEYLDSPNVKIYIHDSSKDMFYELEDLRSYLREIRDRSVLRLFESGDVSGGLPMAGIGIAGGVGHFEDPSYFSEPEFDSDFQHQHIHKSKGSVGKGAPYYIGSTASLPRGTTLLRTYSPAVGNIPADRLKSLPTDGYMSSPERGSRYEDPYYSQYASRSGSITPVIDEEVSDTELLDESYSLYGVKLPPGGPRAAPRSPFPPPAGVPYDTTTLRVENMERQLANLTGLLQKHLTHAPATHLQVPGRGDNYRAGDEFDKNSSSSSASLPDDSYLRSDSKAPKLGKSGCHKSVSFEKSVSFSDEPPDMNSPKQHSPQHAADTKPAKPAIKSSTLPRTSSQERDRLKPAPPPKPASLSPSQYDSRNIYRDLQLTPEMYNQLRALQKKAKDLRAEVRNLRRMSQAQAHSVKDTIRDTFIKIRAMLMAGGEQVWQAGMDQERVRLTREEDLYKQEMLRLEKDLSDLESTVEELRGNVINRKTRVNMSDVENMALVLSKSSKTVADLKLRFPGLQDGMKTFLSTEMEKVMREEKFLKEEPERLESALRRCKKLTGTLVTLKRLASVQEQRLPCSNSSTEDRLSPTVTETPPITPTSSQHSKPPTGARMGSVLIGGDSANSSDSSQRPENALDALLDELQTFSKPHSNAQLLPDSSEPPAIPVKGIPPINRPPQISEIGRKGSMDSASFLPTQNLTVSTATGSLRRLHSYPSGSDTDSSPPIQPLQKDLSKTTSKPPIPERNAELLQHIAATGRRVPPPPPPRTSSKSPLASPTSPNLPPRSPAAGLQHIQNVQNMIEKPQSQFEQATQNLGLSTLRRNVPNRSSLKDNKSQTLPRNIGSNLQLPNEVEAKNASNSSSCESVNSQDGSKKTRNEELEQRHQELLKKQKALQEQYARLQQLQRGSNTLAVLPEQLLKKTGSESNIIQKMGLQMSTSQMTGSLTNIPNTTANSISRNTLTNTNNTTQTQTTNNSSSSSEDQQTTPSSNSSSTTNKVYETEIL